MPRHVPLVLSVVCALSVLSSASVHAVSTRLDTPGRRAFVIGGPGRLDSAGDRRWPRRWQQTDSSVAAYVDVETVSDPTWLRHEIAAYADAAGDCAELGATWCRRGVLDLDGVPVLYIAAGVHAEVVWLTGEDTAVRLGWRRVVETPTGTLTTDTPPAEFARALLTELPSRLGHEHADDSDRTAGEVERLLYYVDKSIDRIASPGEAVERRRAERLIAANLERVARLGGIELSQVDLPADGSGEAGPLSAPLADRLATVRAWHRRQTPQTPVEQWCAADPIEPAGPLPGLPPRTGEGIDQKGMSSSGGGPPASSPGGALKP